MKPQRIELSRDGNTWLPAFMRVVDVESEAVKPDDELLQPGYRWQRTPQGWAPAVDEATC